MDAQRQSPSKEDSSFSDKNNREPSATPRDEPVEAEANVNGNNTQQVRQNPVVANQAACEIVAARNQSNEAAVQLQANHTATVNDGVDLLDDAAHRQPDGEHTPATNRMLHNLAQEVPLRRAPVQDGLASANPQAGASIDNDGRLRNLQALHNLLIRFFLGERLTVADIALSPPELMIMAELLMKKNKPAVENR